MMLKVEITTIQLILKKMSYLVKYSLFMLMIMVSLTRSIAQNEQLAEEYLIKGEFQKAESLYKNLFENQSYNYTFLDKWIQSLQAQKKYDEARQVIREQLDISAKRNPTNIPVQLHVDLGYNHELQGYTDEAKIEYDKALEYLKNNPNNGYTIAKSFQDHQKLDYALESYQTMMAVFPTANYFSQIAIIYGEKGEIEKMFNTYLDMLSRQNSDLLNIQRFMGRFLAEDDQGKNNVLLRKLLVQRIQNEPKIEWYKMLSWLYLQQKDYSKALNQEKAVYRMTLSDLNGVIDIGKIAFDDGDFFTSNDAFSFVLEQPTDIDNQIFAHYYLLESQKKVEKDMNKIDPAFQNFFKTFGTAANTYKVQSSYAQFLAFYKNEAKKAIELLQNTLKNNLDTFKKGELKLQLGDILVFTEGYNQALVIFTQVQNDLKNHPLAQTARYKVAQTSYFDGDFEWANTQLKVLKKGTTKLIANDAIDLSLLISDNIAQDSVQTALKSYAKADLLAYQNKTQQAIDTLSLVLLNHKGHPIEDEALFKQAKLYEKLEKYADAEKNYLSILQLNQDDILIDDALYQLAVLYDEKLIDEEKAKMYYEKIVVEQSSSIFLVPARKRFRELRGDEVVP